MEFVASLLSSNTFISLIAQFEIIAYTISYDLNGGERSENLPFPIQSRTLSQFLTLPERIMHLLDGQGLI